MGTAERKPSRKRCADGRVRTHDVPAFRPARGSN